MKIAVTQPNFIPWIGFFDLLDEVDLWVVMDYTQMVKRSFIVRNKIITKDEQVKWLTVNLKKSPQKTPINKALIEREGGWWEDHWAKIYDSYRHSPFFSSLADKIHDLLKPRPEEKFLHEYNTRIIKTCCEWMELPVDIVYGSSVFDDLTVTPQEQVMAFCNYYDAKKYYNFKNGVEAGLYDPVYFNEAGIDLFKQDYKHPQYAQPFEVFHPYLSIIDLFFNEGTNVLDIIRSGRNWVKMNQE